MATFADMEQANPDIRNQYDWWRGARQEKGEDPVKRSGKGYAVNISGNALDARSLIKQENSYDVPKPPGCRRALGRGFGNRQPLRNRIPPAPA